MSASLGAKCMNKAIMDRHELTLGAMRDAALFEAVIVQKNADATKEMAMRRICHRWNDGTISKEMPKTRFRMLTDLGNILFVRVA